LGQGTRNGERLTKKSFELVAEGSYCEQLLRTSIGREFQIVAAATEKLRTKTCQTPLASGGNTLVMV